MLQGKDLVIVDKGIMRKEILLVEKYFDSFLLFSLVIEAVEAWCSYASRYWETWFDHASSARWLVWMNKG
jgi:hypothetical protein